MINVGVCDPLHTEAVGNLLPESGEIKNVGKE
jgi:hypothetical protein